VRPTSIALTWIILAQVSAGSKTGMAQVGTGLRIVEVGTGLRMRKLLHLKGVSRQRHDADAVRVLAGSRTAGRIPDEIRTA
jgi:hypothetical protein